MGGFGTMGGRLPTRSREEPTRSPEPEPDPDRQYEERVEERRPCDPHAFPSDPEDVRIVSTYGDGCEIEAECPRCGATLYRELLAEDMDVIVDGRADR